MAKNKTPPVPQMSGQELALLEKQGVTLDQLNKILSSEQINTQRSQEILRGISGLYNPDGTINQDALASLKQRTLAQQQQQEGLAQQGLGFLSGAFTPTDLENVSGQAGLEEAGQYLRALQGNVPLSAALSQQEAERFKKLKESAGQRGIRIAGDDPFTATSDSTAGNQLLSQLRKESQFNREVQRENALGRLQAANLNRLGFGLQRQGQLAGIAQGAQFAPGSSSLGYLSAAGQEGPGSLLGSFQGLSQSYGQAAQPYQQQRYLQYQAALQNQANQQAGNAGFGSLIGGLGGAAIGSFGGPVGAGLGFGIGSGVGGAIGGSGLSNRQQVGLGAFSLGAGLPLSYFLSRQAKNSGTGATTP